MKKYFQDMRGTLFFLLFLIIITLFVSNKTQDFWDGKLPAGGDFIAHYTVLEKTVGFFSSTVAGTPGSAWYHEGNAGYPLFYYYQPFAYIFLSLFTFLLSFIPPFSPMSIYKIAILLAYLFIPISIFFASRCFGFRRKPALYAALVSLYVSSASSYSAIGTFDFASVFTYGLLTHLFALPLFSWCLGIYYQLFIGCSEQHTQKNNAENKELSQESSFFSKKHAIGIILFVMLFYTHILIGILAGFALGIFFIVGFFSRKNKKDLLKQGCVHLLLFLFLIAPFFFALLKTKEFYGGLTMSYATYLSGFGSSFLKDYVQGAFLDFGRTIPILTLFSILGIFFIIKEALCKQKKYALPLLLLLLVSVGFVLGWFSLFFAQIPFLSWYPVGKTILLVQYISIFFAGYAVGTIDAFLFAFCEKKKFPQRYMVFFYGLLVLGALVLTIPQQQPLSFSLTSEHVAVLEYLKMQERNTRVYIYEDMKKSSALMPELVVLYSKKPTFNTVNGFHETISVPYTWFYTRDLQPTYWIDSLFVTGYELSYKTETQRNYTTILYKTENYTLYEIPRTGYFDIVRADTAAFLSLKDAIGLMKTWLQSSMPLHKQHIVLIHELGTVTNLTAIPMTSYPFSNYLVKNPEKEDDYLFYSDEETGKLLQPIFQWNTTSKQFSSTIPQDTLPREQCPQTTISNQTFDEVVYRATLIKKENTSEQNCFLLLKVSMHPDWKATIQREDGTRETAHIYHLSPSFMGILLDPLEEGTYTVTFTFTGKPLLRVMFFFLLFGVLLILAYYFRNLRKAKIEKQDENASKKQDIKENKVR